MELLRARVRYPFAREYGVGLAGAINLSSNESPLGPSPSVVRAVRREAARVGLYPDPKAEELKKEISRYIGVDEKCIVLGNGSDELIDMSCKAFLDQGDVVLIPLPTFSMYEISCRVNGGTPKFVELRNFEWDSNSLVAAMSSAKLAFIARPNNPTGNGIDEAGLERLLALGKPIVVDEAYAEFAGRSVARQAQSRDNLIVLRTFSKAFGMAGLRIGYAIASPRIAEVLEEIRPPFNVNRLAQVAAIAALRDRQYLRKVVSTVRAGAKLFEQGTFEARRARPAFGCELHHGRCYAAWLLGAGTLRLLGKKQDPHPRPFWISWGGGEVGEDNRRHSAAEQEARARAQKIQRREIDGCETCASEQGALAGTGDPSARGRRHRGGGQGGEATFRADEGS